MPDVNAMLGDIELRGRRCASPVPYLVSQAPPGAWGQPAVYHGSRSGISATT